MTARGVPPAVYPLCGACCQGRGAQVLVLGGKGGVPKSWSWPGGGLYPSLGPGQRRGDNPSPDPGREEGTPFSPERTWDQTPGKGPGPEAMGYPSNEQTEKMTFPSTSYTGSNKKFLLRDCRSCTVCDVVCMGGGVPLSFPGGVPLF